ncbi:hypothetical protein VNI00_006364 [Paramarasmius palmivorus]|uniref:Uncharacterized protein n=1 Tax=Paramarasmius palmivorus TaxID=297713 RepID=A0AAW0D8Q4_9AGAR
MDLLHRVVGHWTHANTLLAAKSGSDARVRLMRPLLEAFEALLVPSAFDDGIRAMEALGYGDETGLGRSIRVELVDTLSDGDPVLQVLLALYDRPTVQCYRQWAQQVIETASSTVNAHSPAVQALADELRHLIALLSLRQTYTRSIVPLLALVSCSVVLLEQASDSGDTWTIFGRWMNEKEELRVDVPVDDRAEMGTTTGKPKL